MCAWKHYSFPFQTNSLSLSLTLTLRSITNLVEEMMLLSIAVFFNKIVCVFDVLICCDFSYAIDEIWQYGAIFTNMCLHENKKFCIFVPPKKKSSLERRSTRLLKQHTINSPFIFNVNSRILSRVILFDMYHLQFLAQNQFPSKWSMFWLLLEAFSIRFSWCHHNHISIKQFKPKIKNSHLNTHLGITFLHSSCWEWEKVNVVFVFIGVVGAFYNENKQYNTEFVRIGSKSLQAN